MAPSTDRLPAMYNCSACACDTCIAAQNATTTKLLCAQLAPKTAGPRSPLLPCVPMPLPLKHPLAAAPCLPPAAAVQHTKGALNSL